MQDYTVTIDDLNVQVTADALAELDITVLPGGAYHLLRDGVGYRCRVVHASPHSKRLTVSVNGRHFDLSLADRYDQIVTQLGFATTAVIDNKEITAPMPGLILDIMVAEGEDVKSGTPLLILEAMKMENVLKSTGEGTIKTIKVTKGQAVDKRQLLIELE